MTIYLHNNLSRKKEAFEPIDAKNIRVYACGPTVYNYAHIGNARPAVVFDLLVRLLRHEYGSTQVKYARNITDIDDRIMAAAKETGQDISAITEKFTRIYREDMTAIGVQAPDFEPHATEYIPQMIAIIGKLVAGGFAYEAQGHVLFHVPAFKDYGRLSRRNRDDMIAGARVEVAPYKKDPADFVLWKPSTNDQPGWDSPWGHGRPGWHIECSAMCEALHGDHFDIHAGGEDLIFPHHENEIAQSVCAHGGTPYANYWLHNGFLTMDGEKMSKSLGNVFLVHDLLKKAPGEVLRYALLSAQYRQPLDWSEALLQQARAVLDRYYGILQRAAGIPRAEVPPALLDALKDDLNTPQALAILAELSRDPQRVGEFHAAAEFMGLLQKTPEEWFRSGVDTAAVEMKIAQLKEARAAKDYARADSIRKELADVHSVSVSITPAGIEWRKT